MKNKKMIILIIIVMGLVGFGSFLKMNDKKELKEAVVDKKEVNTSLALEEERQKGSICLEVITLLYEDSNYYYNVPTSCYGDSVFISFDDGTRLTIKQALKEKRVTIDELIEAGAKIYKEAKMSIQPVNPKPDYSIQPVTWVLKNIPQGLTCANVVSILYEDNYYKYTVSNPCYIYENFVVYNNGSKYNLQEALEKGKVTINELIKAGAKINKEGKVSIQPVESEPDYSIQPVTWEIKTISSGDVCAHVMTELYEDNKYTYTVSNPCIISSNYVLFNNGKMYTIKSALNKRLVTINELVDALNNKGIEVFKEAK